MTKNICLCKKIITFINESPLEELGQLTLLHVSKKFDINQSQLSRIFNKTMDVNLSDFFLRVKLLKSALLMHQNETLSIKEIANIAGFSDPEYFNTVFKKHFGKCPSVYSPFKK